MDMPEGLITCAVEPAPAAADGSADRRLQEAEQRLATITANLPGVVFQRLRRPDGSIIYPFFSAGLKAVLGYTPEEVKVNAAGCLDIVHWADRGDHLRLIHLSAAQLCPCVEEFRAIARDGEIRWLRGTSRPHAQADGGIVWDGVLLDVTALKRTEQTLHMILDHAADCIITIDGRGHMETVNAATQKLFGYTAAEMIGAPVHMLLPESDRPRHRRYLQHLISAGAARRLDHSPRELRGQRKDGTVFPLELAISEMRLEWGHRLFIAIGRDITRRKRTEAALRESEQRLRNIAANLPGIVFQRVLRADGGIQFTYVSEGCRRILGLAADDLMADSGLFLDALSPDGRERYLRRLHQSARDLSPIEDDLRLHTRDGRECWLHGRSRPRLMDDGSIAWEGVLLDITDRKKAEQQLTFLAYHDPLTEVANRPFFLEKVSEICAADRHPVVLSLGIDRFGIINTTLGHAMGDALLKAVAERLGHSLRPGDMVARAGGDRFLALLPDLSDGREIAALCDTLLQSLARPFFLEGQELEISACLGIGAGPEDGTDGPTLVRNADAALARAKAGGPGSVQRFLPQMREGAGRTLALHHRLRRALDNDEFLPYFQPQVELRNGRIVGMEALARWASPDGMVSPADFIPVAEEYGLIDGICERMLTACARQMRQWQEQGLAVVPVAVNISGRQFHHPRRLVQTLETVLADSGLAPRLLELELTESSAMRDPDSAISVVGLLQQMGLDCAIDDFGTGYSSLSVLKRFPIKKLKVDRSFVMDLTTDPNDAAIVNAILAMAHALKLKVVAEGVETADHLHFLRNVGCDQIQGYLFSRPLPAQEMGAMLARGDRLKMPC